MEAFNDTPIVNGTAYPTVTLQPKSYRFRILNAANDRFWNLQWYVADATGTEVALKATEVAAAQTDPNVFPTPDTTLSPAGPSWIQIGTEGGFLPGPGRRPQPADHLDHRPDAVRRRQRRQALAAARARRAGRRDRRLLPVRGQDADPLQRRPGGVPGAGRHATTTTRADPDLSPVGAPTTLPGYGPNTRTIMQVNIAAATPAPAFNLTALQAAFRHHADGSGVFESGQNPIIVGQAAYNSAYGTNFAASGWCNAPGTARAPAATGSPASRSRAADLFGFNTLEGA